MCRIGRPYMGESDCAQSNCVGVSIIIDFYEFNLTMWQTALVCTCLYE